MIKPNLEEMLKDQLFLGRGWRYFHRLRRCRFLKSRHHPAPTTGPARGATTQPARGKIEFTQ